MGKDALSGINSGKKVIATDKGERKAVPDVEKDEKIVELTGNRI